MPKDWLLRSKKLASLVHRSWFIEKKQFNSQKGVFHLWIIFVILAIILGAVLVSSNNFKSFIKPTPKQATPSPTATQTTSPKITPNAAKQVDKTDKEWMDKYCAQEVVKLPEAPFKYKSKEGPTRNGPMVWVSKFFPKDMRFDHQSGCAIDYKYDADEAYASLGVKNVASIEYTNEFESRVDELITSKIDSSWKKLSPLGKEQSGNPAYTYKGFPMVFTRENPDLGTVEYIDIFFGAGTLYVKIEFYVK